MEIIRWRSLSARLHRRRIARFAYDRGAGYAVIELADGDELLISADPEGLPYHD
jgi:hypothetical protein